jgi:HSP20 family protein
MRRTDDPNEVLQRQVEQLFHDLVYRRHPESHFTDAPWAPAADLDVSKDRARVLLELAGIARENVKVRLAGRVLEITGHRPRPTPSPDARYHRAEIFFGEFRRLIELPWDADADHVEARFRDGLLEVTLHRAPVASRTEIPIEEPRS